MKARRSIFNFRLSFLLTIFLLFILTAGKGCYSTSPSELKTLDGNISTAELPVHKNIVVLLHGMNVPGDRGILELKNKLNSDIENAEIIILDRQNSATAPIGQQAEEAYHALKKQMEERGFLIDSPICIVGDSQGGLLALEVYRQYQNSLNVIGIVTNHSPLEGTPGITASEKEIGRFKQSLINLLSVSSLLEKFNLNKDIISYEINGIDFKQLLTGNMDQRVVKELTANSLALKSIQTTLSSVTIPVLVLGGYADTLTSMRALFGFASQNPAYYDLITIVLKILDDIAAQAEDTSAILVAQALNQLEEAFGAVIGNKENDSFVPLYSQMATNSLISPSVVRNIQPGYHHFFGMTTDKGIYFSIVKFINRAFEARQ
jgi:surfactin synthase thioesterase subunit